MEEIADSYRRLSSLFPMLLFVINISSDLKLSLIKLSLDLKSDFKTM